MTLEARCVSVKMGQKRPAFEVQVLSENIGPAGKVKLKVFFDAKRGRSKIKFEQPNRTKYVKFTVKHSSTIYSKRKTDNKKQKPMLKKSVKSIVEPFPCCENRSTLVCH